jgi:hypothetical protein
MSNEAAEGPKLDKMNKADLTTYADSIGVTVDPEWTKAQIIAAIEDGPQAETSGDRTHDGEDPLAAEPVQTAEPMGEQPAGDGRPDMSSGPDEQPALVVKSGGRKVKVRGFFGSFHKAVFHEEAGNTGWGVAEKVSDETLDILRSQFPGAEIEEVD